MRQTFGSVIVLLDADEGRARSSVLLQNLSSWLAHWIGWYLERNGVAEGQNLHLIYDRSVSVLGSGVLEVAEDIVALGRTAAQSGCSYACEISMASALAHRERLDVLLAGEVVKTAVLNPVDCTATEHGRYILSLAERLSAAGIALIFAGSPTFWTEIGALESQVVNSTNFRMVPNAAVRNIWLFKQVDAQEHESERADEVGALAPHELFSPCDNRFATYVTMDGELYPCLGLIGCREWCLGQVDDAPQESRLARETDLKAMLDAWGDRGPVLDPGIAYRRFPALNPVCAAHRSAILVSTFAANEQETIHVE